MNTAILIATRELRDRSRLLVIAAGMAVIPFLVALALRHDRQTGMAVMAGIVALVYSGAVALMLGVSTIGAELTEKRLSFLFARPLSPVAMWGGKAAAALVICLGAFAIIVLPTWLFAHEAWSNLSFGGGVTALRVAGLCAALFFGGHVASTMSRSRSARVGLDVAFSVMTLFALFALLRPLLLVDAGETATSFLIAIGVAVLAVFAVAPVWQLARGRIDPRRNHAALSTVLWSGVAIILAVAAACVLWLTSAPLSAMTEIYALNQSPTGAWVFVEGQARAGSRYSASYLINSATGERERLEMPLLSPYAFSPDGRTVAWLENTAYLTSFDSKGADMRERLESAERLKGTGAFRLYTRRLEPGAKPVATPLVVAMPGRVQLSDDGSRIAMAIGQRLEVYDIVSGRLLAAAQTPAGADVDSIIFAGPDVVRFVEYGLVARAPFLRIGSLDVRTRKLTTIERPAPWMFAGATFNADGTRIYLPNESAVLDPRTGAVLATLPVQPEKPDAGAMLRDGSLIVTRDLKLFHITAGGQIAAEMPIPMPAGYVAGQIGASKILLEGRQGSVIVDLAARTAGVPMRVYGPILSRSRSVVPQFTENATFVGIGPGRKFLLWDARTGAKRPFPG